MSVCEGFLKYEDTTHARKHSCYTKLVSCYRINPVRQHQHHQRNQKKTKEKKMFTFSFFGS
jgi:hypothetical protein